MAVLDKNKLQHRLTMLALTRKDLADRAGVSLRTVQNAIRGEAISPTTHMALAKALRVRPEAVLGDARLDDDEPRQPETTSPPMPQLSTAERNLEANGELSEVIQAWPALPQQTRLAILAMTCAAT